MEEVTETRARCQGPFLDPRLLELLELHQALTVRRLDDPDPEERDRLTAQMEKP